MLPDFHGCEKYIRRHLRMRMALFRFMASEAPVWDCLGPLLWAWNKTEQQVIEEAVQLISTRKERRPGRGWGQSRAFLLWFNYVMSPTSLLAEYLVHKWWCYWGGGSRRKDHWVGGRDALGVYYLFLAHAQFLGQQLPFTTCLSHRAMVFFPNVLGQGLWTEPSEIIW